MVTSMLLFWVGALLSVLSLGYLLGGARPPASRPRRGPGLYLERVKTGSRESLPAPGPRRPDPRD